MDAAIVNGEFVTYSHVKTRKVFTITIEFPEEQALDVLNTLGAPVGGDSKPVAVALLDKQVYSKPPVVGKSDIQQTEGEKLRTRAVILCTESDFQQFCNSQYMYPHDLQEYCSERAEKLAVDYIYQQCQIKSRSELATNQNAQVYFLELLRQFDAWKVSNRYADILSR